ncbi:MAG: hypothetical protein Q8P35_00470 [Candidatus Yanofskybacteria bacterium]|nr:hypothetical protein [Candidatus Yanofskybacteria bacterium]
MIGNLLVIALLVVWVAYVRQEDEKGEESLASMHAWCDASDAFTTWRLRNPGVYIGLSDEGRRLLTANLKAYDWFLRTHPFVDGTSHREWLASLFYDLPPKTPVPFSPKKAPHGEGPFI